MTISVIFNSRALPPEPLIFWDRSSLSWISPVRLAGKKAPRIHLSPPFLHWNGTCTSLPSSLCDLWVTNSPGFLHRFWYPDSNPHTCIATILPTEPSPWIFFIIFFYNYLVSHSIISPGFIHDVTCLRTSFLLNFESHLILIWVTHAFSPPENRIWLSLKQEGSCSTFWLLCLGPFLGFSEPPPHL